MTSPNLTIWHQRTDSEDRKCGPTRSLFQPMRSGLDLCLVQNVPEPKMEGGTRESVVRLL